MPINFKKKNSKSMLIIPLIFASVVASLLSFKKPPQYTELVFPKPLWEEAFFKKKFSLIHKLFYKF